MENNGIGRKELFTQFLSTLKDRELLLERELEVAYLVTTGKSYDEIAQTIFRASKPKKAKTISDSVKRKVEWITQTRAKMLAHKAAGETIDQIPIEGIFPVQLETAIYQYRIRTLGEMREKGRKFLGGKVGISERSINMMSWVLKFFDVEF